MYVQPIMVTTVPEVTVVHAGATGQIAEGKSLNWKYERT